MHGEQTHGAGLHPAACNSAKPHAPGGGRAAGSQDTGPVRKGQKDVAVWETWGPRSLIPVMGEGRQDGEWQRPRFPRMARPLPGAPLHRPADTPRRCLLTDWPLEHELPPRGLPGPHGTKGRACTERPSTRRTRSGANHTGATERPRVQEWPRDQRGWAAVPRAWPQTGHMGQAAREGRRSRRTCVPVCPMKHEQLEPFTNRTPDKPGKQTDFIKRQPVPSPHSQPTQIQSTADSRVRPGFTAHHLYLLSSAVHSMMDLGVHF